MKVLTVVTNLGMGGTQRVAQNYALALAGLGHEVRVLAYSGGGPRRAAFAAAGVQVWTAESPGDLDRFLREVSAWGGDVVHIHREGRSNRTETHIIHYMKQAGLRILETNVFGEFDKSLPPNTIDLHLQLTNWSYHRWWKRAEGRANKERAVILPNSVDENSFFPLSSDERQHAREKLGVAKDAFVFGRIGQAIESKWHTGIIESFAGLAASRPTVWLLLVGAPNNIQEGVAQLPESLRGRVMVRPVTGDDQTLRQYYGAMDCFLHAARIGESFGLVLCEAMMMGLPVITLATPLRDNSQTEVVEHERFGLVALNVTSMTAAMTRIMQDHKLINAARLQARDWVVARFGSKRLAMRFAELASAICGDRPIELANPLDVQRQTYRLLNRGVGQLSLFHRLAFELVDTQPYNALLAILRMWRARRHRDNAS